MVMSISSPLSLVLFLKNGGRGRGRDGGGFVILRIFQPPLGIATTTAGRGRDDRSHFEDQAQAQASKY